MFESKLLHAADQPLENIYLQRLNLQLRHCWRQLTWASRSRPLIGTCIKLPSWLWIHQQFVPIHDTASMVLSTSHLRYTGSCSINTAKQTVTHLYFANHLICRGALTKLPITISSCVWYMIYATNNRWNQHQMRVHSPKALQQQHGWLRYTNHPSQQMQAIRQRNLFKWTCWAHMGSSKLKRYGVPQLSALLILCYWQGHLMWQAVQNPAEQQRPPSCLLLWCIQTNNFPMLNAEQSIYAG